jgi:signal transduction histidine kinase/DNA-binding response OmpR family regulator/HAMP domain-containing protein
MNTVKGRIFAYLIGFTLISGTMAAVGRWYLDQTRDAFTSLAEDRVNALKYLKATSDALGLRIVDYAQKARDGSAEFPAARNAVGEARAVARDQWRRFTATRMTPAQLRALEEVTPLFDRAIRESGLLEDLLGRGDREGVNRFVAQSLYPSIDPVVQRLDALTTLTAVAAEETYREGVASYRTALTAVIGAFLVTMVLIGLAAFNVVGALTRPLESITRVAAQVTAGDHDVHVPHTRRPDEVGHVARTVRDFRDALAGLENRRWVDAAIARVTDSLQGAQTRADLARGLLSELVPLVGGAVGALYIWSADRGAYVRAGGWGFDEGTRAPRAYPPGAGLIGEAAEQRQRIVVRDVPTSELPVASGLLAGRPGTVVVAPAVATGTTACVGVVELGTFGEITAAHERLFDALLPRLALNVEILERRLAARALLEETQRQAAELMTQRQELERANRFKSDFLASMSHEIRTPLNAITGLTHLTMLTELDARQRDYLDKVRLAADSLLGLVNDILDYSKIEAGKFDLEQAPFELAQVLDRLAAILSTKAHEKHLELLFDVAPDVPQRLVGDALRLGQVLINLANNAVKFTPEGEIVLRVRADAPQDGRVRFTFSVRDTGIGMTDEVRARLFQSFEQGDRSMTRRYGGTGLGLAISKRLVELMGGTIGVESAPGHGSTFTFDATFALDASASPASPQIVPDLRDKLVLIADDSAASRQYLDESLRAFGLRTNTAADGREAVSLARDIRPDVVLLDWRMPTLDGIDAAREIAAANGHTPRLVLMTAFGKDDATKAAEGVPLDAVLTKPLSPSTLLDTLLRIFAVDAQRQTSERPAAATGDLRGLRVLVVEDNPVNQLVTTELLKHQGVEVMVAETGTQAVSLASAQQFDAVLMDVQMPEMDGIEATRRIRASGSKVPIIAATASAIASEVAEYEAAGMDAYVLKPFDVAHLLRTVARHAKREMRKEGGNERRSGK